MKILIVDRKPPKLDGSTLVRTLRAYGMLTAALMWSCATPAPLVATDQDGTPIAIQQEQRDRTLVVDLQNTSGEGEVLLRRSAGAWPRHLVFRVMPGGAVHALIVRTDTGVLFTPFADTDPKPRTVRVPPSLYSARTAQIEVHWKP